MSEVRPHVVIKVVQPIQLVVQRASLRESLQPKRLIREQEAKQGPFVLAEPPKRANRTGKTVGCSG